jgi:thiamine-monophosphate kinase
VDEFGLIRRYFTRDPHSPDVVVGVGDDAAILKPTPGLLQVQVIDTLVEGTHFPPGMNAVDIGYRLVAVNLSDIAAMGATPRWMTLALTLSDKDEQWVEEFGAGLFAAAGEHDVALVGGDTTAGDVVVASLHITGEVEEGKVLLRSGAQVGDTVYVTGTIGDAAAGLEMIENERTSATMAFSSDASSDRRLESTRASNSGAGRMQRLISRTDLLATCARCSTQAASARP